MCGGVGFKIKNIPDSELKKFYQPDMIEKFKKEGEARSFFWERNPALPVLLDGGIRLLPWGNKEHGLDLPKTGWARTESLHDRRWDYLKPELVDIPVDSGYEKSVWFKIEGVKGIAITRKGERYVYMITKEASEEYKKQTKHDREPLGLGPPPQFTLKQNCLGYQSRP